MTIAHNLLIGGKTVPAASGRRTEDRSPCTGDVYAMIAAAGTRRWAGGNVKSTAYHMRYAATTATAPESRFEERRHVR